jgi:hypothetical protein
MLAFTSFDRSARPRGRLVLKRLSIYPGVTPSSPCGRCITSGFTVAAEIPSAGAEFLTESNGAGGNGR